MAVDRYVILGLASVRSPWFRIVTGWAMAGSLPLDFVKCVSPEELRVRLRSGRPHSAVLLDAGLPGVDRDLIALALDHGASPIVVTAPNVDRDHLSLGAVASVPPDFVRSDLLEVLHDHCTPIQRGTSIETPAIEPSLQAESQLIAVIGRVGSGASTAAIAAAQGLADDPKLGGWVVLADLARRADQAMLHDADDVVPGVQELIDAHRSATPATALVRSLTFDIPERGYDLLLGLRRSRDWVALRPRSFAASISGLRRAYHAVIVDLDDDLEGEADSGSVDVEDRNIAARHCVTHADVILAVGDASLVGVHSLVRLIDEMVQLGADARRIQPVINRGPRSGRAKAELTATIADLVSADVADVLASPIFLPERKRLDDLHRNASRLPNTLSAPLVGAIRAGLQRSEPASAPEPEPQLVAPGSLGSWGEDDWDEDLPDQWGEQ
ncbi:MAG: hypothetical protein ACI8Y4_001233 [Candidatus Poriferisodalaceae bacterium]|jgi:hypothetical protein